jgi:hypothetical protein
MIRQGYITGSYISVYNMNLAFGDLSFNCARFPKTMPDYKWGKLSDTYDKYMYCLSYSYGFDLVKLVSTQVW